jgi:Acyclic terpene utilisation family protein AtuA
MTEPPRVTEPLRVGNASGFYGDRFAAMREMLTGGPLDVLTGDYLAELTMLILGRQRLKDPAGGYARTFLRQLEECLGLALERGVRIVTNAGGLNPAGLADAVSGLADRLGLAVRVAHVEGDDLLPRAAELGLDGALTANAYLGGWGIAACLDAGADVVVTGRVTDASLVAGPAAAHFGWARDDHDRLAGATVAGHVVECGAQATGGNFAFFRELPDLGRAGFPIAEIHADGSAVITKHPGTDGAVTVDTVTAQLLYEIGGPRYLGPDVTSRFDTIALESDGPDRVRISGVRGEAPPPDAKVCLNTLAGFRNSATFVLCGLDIDAKAALARRQVEAEVGAEGVTWTLARTEHADADTEEAASALLHATVRTPDAARAKGFSRACVELALASYPGFTLTAPPGDGTPVGVYRPEFVPAGTLAHTAVLPDGSRVDIAPHPAPATGAPPVEPDPVPPPEPGPTRRVPLGTILGARSGDKGGDANLGVWARDEAAHRWLAHELTTDRLRELLPEAKDLEISRHPLPNLRAVNFVLHGLLGQGVAASTRFDPQAKALGEWLRSRLADVPETLLEEGRS